MECLHRFCRECIDKSMRMGYIFKPNTECFFSPTNANDFCLLITRGRNNECPACRAHCASRRSLRDDPNYDALIAVLYPDIDKSEAEEFAFDKEEKARNKQIQASIAQTSRRQLEALGKKRTTGKATTSVFMRSHTNTRGRRRKSSEPQGSENEDDGVNNDVEKDSSSSEEHEPCTKVRPRRQKRWGVGVSGVRSSLPSSSADGGCDDNDVETPNREMTGVGTSEILAWGRGGIRSHTRHGSLSNSAAKTSRNTRGFQTHGSY
ncbi:hypothetical protein L1987_83323 [Smallanthus sonchifolius]|uniref:Uncharacterized protein n=1 Tax=Smallanthus sonchifolius TaxID=185202 RepID=A0ACB8YCT6_9ASTR|nr:hypothetical protein L1987_83323 [Smallanthus sonchifolius]